MVPLLSWSIGLMTLLICGCRRESSPEVLVADAVPAHPVERQQQISGHATGAEPFLSDECPPPDRSASADIAGHAEALVPLKAG
jgi:hypothetical protein